MSKSEVLELEEAIKDIMEEEKEKNPKTPKRYDWINEVRSRKRMKRWCRCRLLLSERSGDESTQSPLHGPHSPQGPSPIEGIIRSMLRKIQMGFTQDGQNPHGLQILSSWAKEDVKIWEVACQSISIDFNFGPLVRPCFIKGYWTCWLACKLG